MEMGAFTLSFGCALIPTSPEVGGIITAAGVLWAAWFGPFKVEL